jgi:hypothetical protein
MFQRNFLLLSLGAGDVDNMFHRDVDNHLSDCTGGHYLKILVWEFLPL